MVFRSVHCKIIFLKSLYPTVSGDTLLKINASLRLEYSNRQGQMDSGKQVSLDLKGPMEKGSSYCSWAFGRLGIPEGPARAAVWNVGEPVTASPKPGL